MAAKIARALEATALIGALLTIPLAILGEQGLGAAWVPVADWVIWAVFVLEYGTQVVINSRRLLYIKRNPLNFAVIVLSYPQLPILFSLVRLARLARFVRFLRVLGVTARAVSVLRIIFWRRGLLCVAAISTAVIFAGGAALVLLEPQTVRGGLADGVWWAIVTASTVGYGDIAPSTMWGRAIAIVLMLCGVGLMSTLAASITAHFLGHQESAGLTELTQRMARIEATLNELRTAKFADVDGRLAVADPGPISLDGAGIRPSAQSQVEVNRRAEVAS